MPNAIILSVERAVAPAVCDVSDDPPCLVARQ
jgi:hypothetical protein